MFTSVRQFISSRRKFVLIVLAGAATFSYFSFGAIMKSLSLAANTKSSPAPIESSRIGSLLLSDLNETLLNQSPELRQEITQALREVNRDDVGCIAPIVFLASSDLHHSRVAPFSCSFSDYKILIIEAETLAKLPDGELVSLEQLLQRDNVNRGVSIQFNLTSWRWTDSNH